MLEWWQERVVYQIYPRSFYDTNGDGIGDIPGIIAKLDYLKSLGIGAIWLSSVYVSPNYDFGYDVANYRDINPEYGTMSDMRRLLKEAERRDIKVIMDLVVNHTSSQHPWFQAARDINSPYRDYYIWRAGKVNNLGKRLPPNNWTSFFGGPAWSKDDNSGEYYLHLFSPQQPDLNWHNPKVVSEVEDIMRFWLGLGVAGFRCDVINLIAKTSLKDGRRRNFITGREHYLNSAGTHRLLQRFRKHVWDPFQAVAIGEVPNTSLVEAIDYLQGDELNMLIIFEHLLNNRRYDPARLKHILTTWQENLPWNVLYWESHDTQRLLSRTGIPSRYSYQAATMFATLLFTLRGTPFIYQGQEIGMTNAPFHQIEQIKDVATLSAYQSLRNKRLPSRLAFALAMKSCRDHARTPMQWDSSPSAGFSDGSPWLMVNPNYSTVSVAASQKQQSSVWHFYQHLLKLRTESTPLRQGTIEFLRTPSAILVYDRFDRSKVFRVIVNLSAKTQYQHHDVSGKVVATNYPEAGHNGGTLRAFESIVIRRE